MENNAIMQEWRKQQLLARITEQAQKQAMLQQSCTFSKG
jgi:hypothetical protein